MATYISLLNFTAQGLRDVKDTVKRSESARKLGEKFGVTLKDIYWTQGRYDLVIVSEGSDETALNAFFLSLGKLGNITAQTLRGFTAADMQRIVDKIA
jgi:uncharacterized protein with GYD domain